MSKIRNLSVFVQPPWEGPSIDLFRAEGFKLVDNIETADIVVFNGGEDIHPSVYGEEIIAGAHVNWLDQNRDKLELAAYERCKGKFKFGICRGGQLLNVMNGGRLWQHVSDHDRAHEMIDVHSGKSIWTSSVHHQQFILGPKAELVATTGIAQIKLGRINTAKGRAYRWVRDHELPTGPLAEDPEVVFYKEDRALCIQGHPEYSGYRQFTDYCMDLIERYY